MYIFIYHLTRIIYL